MLFRLPIAMQCRNVAWDPCLVLSGMNGPKIPRHRPAESRKVRDDEQNAKIARFPSSRRNGEAKDS